MRILRSDIEAMARVRGFILCRTLNPQTPYVLVSEFLAEFNGLRTFPCYSLLEGGQWLARKAAFRPYPKAA